MEVANKVTAANVLYYVCVVGAREVSGKNTPRIEKIPSIRPNMDWVADKKSISDHAGNYRKNALSKQQAENAGIYSFITSAARLKDSLLLLLLFDGERSIVKIKKKELYMSV